MSTTVSISQEAREVYATEKDLLDTSAAHQEAIALLRVREKTLLRELELLREEIDERRMQRTACLAAVELKVTGDRFQENATRLLHPRLTPTDTIQRF